MAIFQYGNPMLEWAAKITDPIMKARASETKADVPSPGELGLPSYRNVMVPLHVFLDDPESTIASVGTDKYWFQLLPHDRSEEKVTISDIPKSDIAQYVMGASVEKNRGSYHLLLSEFVTNIWGGTVIVSDDRSVVGAFRRGQQSQVASEEDPAEIVMKSQPGTSRILYFDLAEDKSPGSVPDRPIPDEHLKCALWNAASYVRKTPGYHELALVGDSLRPIFLDSRLVNPLYQIPAEFVEPQYIPNRG
jgi:hypothetical protein